MKHDSNRQISKLYSDASDIEEVPELSGKKKQSKPAETNSHAKLTATDSMSGGIFPINNQQRSVRINSSSQKGRFSSLPLTSLFPVCQRLFHNAVF